MDDPALLSPIVSDEPEPGIPPATAPDVAVGTQVGAGEDVDGILRMLERENIFERPHEGGGAEWAARKEVIRGGTSVVWTWVALWILGIAAVGGGYFGYKEWVRRQHRRAADLVAQARTEAMQGDHEDLVDAERHLREARERNPDDREGPELLLFVFAQRALEDGAFEAGYLNAPLQRAGRLGLDGPHVKAAEAIVAAARGHLESAREAASAAIEGAGDDASVLYVASRVQQRIGEPGAEATLADAVQKDPSIAAASIALAELRADEGRPEEAMRLLDAQLERDPDHLRAHLWKVFLQAGDAAPDAALSELGALIERLDRGAPTDHVLAELARARLLQRKGDAAGATEAVQRASEAGATEPRLLALVAQASLAIGELERARQAASRAVSAAPTSVDFRKLLAEILIAQRDGMRALRVLESVSAEDPEVLALSAQAALIVGSPEALSATGSALESLISANEDVSVELRALLVRVKARTGDAAEALRMAKRLARQAPGDPAVGLALAEAALEAREPREALEAAERLVAAAPESAEGQYLLGRAQRMAGHPEEAEAAFRRALELAPGYADANVALGYLLLDMGAYQDADALYARMLAEGSRATAFVARLGRVEALLGLGNTAEARVQFDAMSEEDRARAGAKVVEARILLAEGQPAQALRQLRPMAEQEGASADLLALYGDALFAARETEAASGVYEAAIRVDAAHPEALLGYAQILLLGEKWREALAIVARVESALAVRIRPPALRARMFMIRGLASIGQGDLEGGRRALRSATELAGAPPESWFHLGESLAAANSPESRAAYEKYLELAPEGPFAARARRAIR